MLHVLNKADLVSQVPNISEPNSVIISAKTGFGLKELLEDIAALLPDTQKRFDLLIPYTEGTLLDEIRQEGLIYSEEYLHDGTKVDAMVDERIVYKVKPFIIDNTD